MKTFLAAIGLAASLAAPQAHAALGDLLFATGGDITIRFESTDALFNSTVSVNGSSQLFPNHGTAIGSMFDLGSFAASTPIDVVLHVLTTGSLFHTGPGTLNSDGLAHAVISVGADGRTLVSFEDMAGGGDRDFNDHVFSLIGVRTVAAIPEPSMLALMGAGLGMLGFLSRRRRPD